MNHPMPSLPYAAEALAPQPEQVDSGNSVWKDESGTDYPQSWWPCLQQCRTDLEPYFLFPDSNPATDRCTGETGWTPDTRFRLGRCLQRDIHQGCIGTLRFRLDLAGIRQTAQTVHHQYFECRESAHPRIKADIGHRCMGTCLLYWLPQPPCGFHRRAAFIEAFWNLVDWEKVAERCVMKRYECTACDYIYDPETGSPETGIAPGTPFEEISDDWTCPICGLYKDAFRPME